MADWAKLKVVDLKAELKRRGLPQAGLKTELVARLAEADQQEASEPAEELVEEEDEEASKPSQTINGDVDETEEKHEQNDEKPVTEVEPASEGKPSPLSEAEPEKPVESDDAPQPGESTPVPVPLPAPEPAPATAADTTASTHTESQPEPSPPARDSQPAETDTTMKEDEPTQDSSLMEAPTEAQKRKRRSASPTPKEEDVARKRARADYEAPQINAVRDAPAEEIDYDRHVEPSVHPATSALCINNLMRPLRPADLRAHIVTLASPPGTTPTDSTVTKFYLDFIRTHAFVALETASAASRVRQLLHGRVWPNESNRKALSIDFIPPEKIDAWIDTEEEGGRRPSNRWEVVYAPTADGSTVEANLALASSPSSSARPPPSKPLSMAQDGINSAPLGPRATSNLADIAPPTGPRGPRRAQPPPPPSGDAQYTRARPSIPFRLVSEDLAQRRVKNMRAFYTDDLARDLGREINRYSFEEGDSFIDRGREIFEGIRPPHRERAVRGRGRGGRSRGGGGGFRPRSDRYIPTGGASDDRRRF
jgi:chemotaxis protein histidine kinase CheA